MFSILFSSCHIIDEILELKVSKYLPWEYLEISACYVFILVDLLINQLAEVWHATAENIVKISTYPIKYSTHDII